VNEVFDINLGKAKSLLEPSKEFHATIYLRGEKEMANMDEWKPSHSDSLALKFNISGLFEQPRTAKRPAIPD